jgi:hypothetical protein
MDEKAVAIMMPDEGTHEKAVAIMTLARGKHRNDVAHGPLDARNREPPVANIALA